MSFMALLGQVQFPIVFSSAIVYREQTSMSLHDKVIHNIGFIQPYKSLFPLDRDGLHDLSFSRYRQMSRLQWQIESAAYLPNVSD